MNLEQIRRLSLSLFQPVEIRLPFRGVSRTDLHDAIAVMKARHSRNPFDKIFGLSALFECRALLAYSENEQEEHAWTWLLRQVSSRIWVALLFGCPLLGENGCYWQPSWSQLMADTAVIEKVPYARSHSVIVPQPVL